MKKGIILEIDKRYVTLLTPDGQFQRAHNQANNYQIGQEITFFPIEEGTKSRSPLIAFLQGMKGKPTFAAMVMILLLISTLLPVYHRNQVYAYMSIDHQSSVELAVNKQLEVLEIIPNNKDGEDVLDKLENWKNEDLSEVSRKILIEMDAQELSDQQVIVVSTVYNGERNEKVDTKLQQEISTLKQHVAKNNMKIQQVKGTKDERKEARQRGMSVGGLKNEAKQKEEKKLNSKQNRKDKDTQSTKTKKEQQLVPSDSTTNQKQTEVPRKQEQSNNGNNSKVNKNQKQENIQKRQEKENNKPTGNQKEKVKEKNKEKNK